MIIMMVYCLDTPKRIVVNWFYKLRFFDRGLLVYLQMKLYRIFDRFSGVRNFECMILFRLLGIRFSNKFRYRYALRVLGRCFGKSRPTQGHKAIAICSTSELGHDNFIGIKADRFKIFLSIFISV